MKGSTLIIVDYILRKQMSPEELADLIRELREQQHLEQKDIAARLKIPLQQYLTYEEGKAEMSISIFLRLMEVLSPSIQDFFQLTKVPIGDEDIDRLKLLIEELESRLGD